MTTQQVITDNLTWVNIVTELSLENGVTYWVQNVSSVTALITEKIGIPDDDTPFHSILPEQSMGVIVDTTLGVWVKGQRDFITISVTQSEYRGP